MSTCISSEGEYSDHRYGDAGDDFTCDRCWVFDDVGALNALADARDRLAKVEALADDWAAGYPDERAAAARLRAALASDPTHEGDAHGNAE